MTAKRWLQRRPKGIGVVWLVVFVAVASRLAAAPPNLVVLVVAEQFRADYLDRYRPAFAEDGFRRLLREGASFPRCRFDHLTTLAAPNTATLATGAYPELHGIVADRWYDRVENRVVGAAEGRSATASDAPLVLSPGRLNGSTFADELGLSTRGRSRVVAVSDRPSPAVLLAGRNPLACYWMRSDGQFITSKYYRHLPPSWVDDFNRLHPARGYEGQAWKALEASQEAAPLRVLRVAGPSATPGFQALYHASPFAMVETFRFAKAAIEAEQLGRGEFTDLLIVNLSAPASLGLETGAQSPLMRDMVLRLDRLLADFFSFLDENIGLERTTLVFTAAHGLPPLPEEAREHGFRAGRIAGETIVATVNAALGERFGGGAYVEKYIYPFVYLSAEARKRPGAEWREMLDVAGEAAVSLPGVASYYAPETGAGSAPSALRNRLRRSWHERRSGELLLVYEPYFVEDYGQGRGTTSGSLYRYDTDVPLILFGSSFKAGRFEQEVDATSVAPTIAAALGIAAPSSATGDVLEDAFVAPEPQPSAPPVSPRLRPSN